MGRADIRRFGRMGWVARVWEFDIKGLVYDIGKFEGKGGDDGWDSEFCPIVTFLEVGYKVRVRLVRWRKDEATQGAERTLGGW